MKNKKMGMWLLSGLMFLGLALPVQAETFYGDDNWNVTFNSNNEMVSSFSTANINDVVGGMQPGDNVIITLRLKSENATATDWYMPWRTGAPTARPGAAPIPTGWYIRTRAGRRTSCSTATP